MNYDKPFNEYTEDEFLDFVRNIYTANKQAFPSEDSHTRAVLIFEKISEHPDGSDLIYYPPNNREDSPEGIVKEIKEWRTANAKPGFKSK